MDSQTNDLNVSIDTKGALDRRIGYIPQPPTSSPGRPKGYNGLNAKNPSSIALAFKKAGLDWRQDFAEAIKANKRERIKLWLRLLPYLVTTGHRAKVKKWKGRASRAALVALEALEQGK